MKMTLSFICILFLSSCSLFKSSTKSPEETKAIQLFNDYTEAFNKGDMAKVISFFSDDFAWISIKPKVFETILRGRAQLIKSYDNYFKTYPDAKTKILDLSYDEGYIWTKELVAWTVGKEKISQKTNAVYYIKEGKIQRLWYFEPEDESEIEE